MKRITVYWRNHPEEMELLSTVDHISVGPDGEELIATDKGAELIRAVARENEDSLWVDSTAEVDPHIAADLIYQWVPNDRQKESLQRLIRMVAQEDQQASEDLAEELEDLLLG